MAIFPVGIPTLYKSLKIPTVGIFYGAPFVKILYLTDLAKKLLSLCTFSYLCPEITITACI